MSRRLAEAEEATRSWNGRFGSGCVTGSVRRSLSHPSGLPSCASVYNELAISILPTGTRTVLNQNRTYAALGWKPSDNTSVEMGYMYQYRPVSNGIVAEQNHSIQLTVRSKTPLQQLFRRLR